MFILATLLLALSMFYFFLSTTRTDNLCFYTAASRMVRSHCSFVIDSFIYLIKKKVSLRIKSWLFSALSFKLSNAKNYKKRLQLAVRHGLLFSILFWFEMISILNCSCYLTCVPHWISLLWKLEFSYSSLIRIF